MRLCQRLKERPSEADIIEIKKEEILMQGNPLKGRSPLELLLGVFLECCH
jgi:hypothetical protein